MAIDQTTVQRYIEVLQRELVASMGCSDPGCIAYVASVAKEALGCFPERIVLKISGSLLRNATGVYVPNSGHLRGPGVAAIMGVVCGDPSRRLEAIAQADDADRAKVRELLDQEDFCNMEVLTDGPKVQAIVEAYCGQDWAEAVLAYGHDNLMKVTKNGEVLFEKQPPQQQDVAPGVPEEDLCIRDIYEFAKQVDLESIRPILQRQVECNWKIAQAGMEQPFGPNIGKSIRKRAGEDVLENARAYAVAGADARMSGCSMTVIANGTSGNQGITVCVPVVVAAQKWGMEEDSLLRALALSNLICIRIKQGMRGISSFCKQINAAIGSAAGIAFLKGASLRQIEDIIRNALSGATGMICDGAKPSCAYKIAVALENAFLGYYLAEEGQTMEGGVGITKTDIEEMIDSVGILVQDGMKETANVILKIMMP